MRRAVFLDRDGVINRCVVRNGKPYAPQSAKDFRLLPRAAAAVQELKAAGFLVIVVTNQPDIGNGLVDAAVVAAMHAKLARRVAVDDIRTCPHRQNENCGCRKPAAGLLLEAAAWWQIDPQKSFMVGDRWSDIVAGQAIGCYSIFLDRGYLETRQITRRLVPDGRAKSLPAAVRLIRALA